MVRIGVVGLGKMGILHASVLGALAGTRVVAVCDTQRFVRRFAGKALRGMHIASDLSEFASLGLDAVYVTTLPGSHYPLVKRIYEEGIAPNVFVEKSLASGFPEAMEMSRLARAHGSVTMVGYQKRFAVTFRKGKELLEEGRVGDVSSFEAYAYSSDSLGAPVEAMPALVRGGVLRDMGCHAIDLALWYFGDLEVLTARDRAGMRGRSTGRREPLAKVPEDFLSARVRTSHGAEGEFRVSTQMEGYRLPEIGITIFGSYGSLKVTEDNVEMTTLDNQPRRWHRHDLNDHVPFLFGVPEYSRENQDFTRAVVDGQSRGPDFDAGARVEKVIDEIVSNQP